MTQTITPTQPPFLIEHFRRDVTPTGFMPEARLVLSPALRSSGLLPTLSDEQSRTLLTLLSLLTANGEVQATAWEVAELLGLSERQARKQLDNLARAKWQGGPVLIQVPRDTSSSLYALSPTLFAQEEVPPISEPLLPLPPIAGREAVIGHSRATYARTREEVERQIAQLNGWDVPEAFATPDEKTYASMRQRLLVIGLTGEQADELLSRFDLARIQRQLQWLPYRRAKHPIGFLLAAIEGDYEPPLSLRNAITEAPPATEIGDQPSEDVLESAPETVAVLPGEIGPTVAPSPEIEPAITPDQTAAPEEPQQPVPEGDTESFTLEVPPELEGSQND